jgi:predicted transcriptional regulator
VGTRARPVPAPRTAARRGLSALRRAGAVSDLLFLYECETREVGQLRAIAERLGVSVQAASHSFRSLRRRGLVELRGGRYKPTVRGVDWLHAALGGMRDDLAERLDRLHIVRTTRAIATGPVAPGDPVALELQDGVLLARPGTTSGSRGRAHSRASTGELVEVGELEGIVPLARGRVRVLALPTARLTEPSLAREVRGAVERWPEGLLLAFGLEAVHVLSRARTFRPVVRFGVAAALAEASRLGVDSLLVVADRDLPRLFEQFAGPDLPELEFLRLGDGRGRRGARTAR